MSEVFVSTSVLEDGLKADIAVGRLIEMGFTRIEIGSTHVFADDYLEKIVGLKDRAILIVHNYFPPAENRMVLNLASADIDIRKASIRQVKTSIDFCDQLGVNLYSFHAGFIGDVSPVSPDKECRNFDFRFNSSNLISRSCAFDLFMDSLKEICDYAARYSMKIACENSGSISKNEFCLMNTADEFQRMFECVDYPHLGMLLDMGHLKLSSIVNRFCPEAFISALQSRVYELHIHENDGIHDQHSCLYPGCGVLELLNKFDFSSAIMTLEGRNLTQAQIAVSYQFLCDARNTCRANRDITI